MIPQWRKVRYEDDGCSKYQCLSCYQTWVSYDAPGWTDTTTNTYHPSWVFCPFCSVRWNREQWERPRKDFLEGIANWWDEYAKRDWWVINEKYTSYKMDRNTSAEVVLKTIRLHQLKPIKISIGKDPQGWYNVLRSH